MDQITRSYQRLLHILRGRIVLNRIVLHDPVGLGRPLAMLLSLLRHMILLKLVRLVYCLIDDGLLLHAAIVHFVPGAVMIIVLSLDLMLTLFLLFKYL